MIAELTGGAGRGGNELSSMEINFVGNPVGSYTGLTELMVLAVQGKDADSPTFPPTPLPGG